MIFNIAIDGPAGAGKSTIAKQLAKTLSFVYVDTGAMYRAMAYYMLQKKVDFSNPKEMEKVCKDVDITISYIDGTQQVFLNGENVTGFIRTEQVGKLASKVSQNSAVREKLVDLQRKMGEVQDVVMDGRDIGTKVLPNANVKIFLTASVKTRALRRFEEYQAKGDNTTLASVEATIIERDHQDMTREISPLVQAEDAILLDSSNMTIEEVVETILQLVKSKRMA